MTEGTCLTSPLTVRAEYLTHQLLPAAFPQHNIAANYDDDGNDVTVTLWLTGDYPARKRFSLFVIGNVVMMVAGGKTRRGTDANVLCFLET